MNLLPVLSVRIARAAVIITLLRPIHNNSTFSIDTSFTCICEIKAHKYKSTFRPFHQWPIVRVRSAWAGYWWIRRLSAKHGPRGVYHHYLSRLPAMSDHWRQSLTALLGQPRGKYGPVKVRVMEVNNRDAKLNPTHAVQMRLICYLFL